MALLCEYDFWCAIWVYLKSLNGSPARSGVQRSGDARGNCWIECPRPRDGFRERGALGPS